MEIFETCQSANELLQSGNEKAARNKLILLLEDLSSRDDEYPELLNQMLRETGLYPYIRESSASWDQRFLLEAFSAHIGFTSESKRTLHREQSRVLGMLLDGKDISVSAPTSFGKSFVIDAYIAQKRPKDVMIIVPTIALMDEMRRRLFHHFGHIYNIVTTTDGEVTSRNIFVFPQERALHYIGKIHHLDLLVVDEFYKISSEHDKERAPALFKAVLKFSTIASQRYFLSPNIGFLTESPITRGMDFVELLNFNTVYLRKHERFKDIKGDESRKFETLRSILEGARRKTLLYAGTFTEIRKLCAWFKNDTLPLETCLSTDFSSWLRDNYSRMWELPDVLERGVGVHNGRMHRCLSQLQVKLFDMDDSGLDIVVSTSSIIEGVNTSAQNVVLWRNKNGSRNITNFSFKNIIGRGGRMFRHFVGDIFILEKPPAEKLDQLEISFPPEIVGGLDAVKDKSYLSDEQVASIDDHDAAMSSILGEERYRTIKDANMISDSDAVFIRSLAESMKQSPEDWNGFGYLNSPRPSDWDNLLYRLMRLKPGSWETQYSTVVSFIHLMSRNWQTPLNVLLEEARLLGHSVEDYFHLERVISYKLSSLVSDANVLHKEIISNGIDVSPFATRVGYAFLPKLVYQLEEIGLPRVLSRRLHNNEVIDLENPDIGLGWACRYLSELGLDNISGAINATNFERFVISYFIEGVTSEIPPNSGI